MTSLSWRSGREVASYEVYFSADKAVVEEGTALVATVNEGNFQPGTLESGQIYSTGRSTRPTTQPLSQ